MPQKKHKPEEIVAKLRQVDILLSQGKSVGEAVRTIGVTQFAYYRWRKEFGELTGLPRGSQEFVRMERIHTGIVKRTGQRIGFRQCQIDSQKGDKLVFAHTRIAETEYIFSTIRDLRDRLSDLVDQGLGELPVQILIVATQHTTGHSSKQRGQAIAAARRDRRKDAAKRAIALAVRFRTPSIARNLRGGGG